MYILTLSGEEVSPFLIYGRFSSRKNPGIRQGPSAETKKKNFFLKLGPSIAEVSPKVRTLYSRS